MSEHNSQETNNGLFAKVGAGIIAGLIVAVLSFMGGIHYEKGKKTAATDQTNGTPLGQGFGNMQGGPGGRGMNIVVGQVTAVSETSISAQDSRSSSTTTLEITSNTKVTDNGASATASSIKIGDNVLIRPNSSNSKQADQIILNPQMPSGGAAPNSTTN